MTTGHALSLPREHLPGYNNNKYLGKPGNFLENVALYKANLFTELLYALFWTRTISVHHQWYNESLKLEPLNPITKNNGSFLEPLK